MVSGLGYARFRFQFKPSGEEVPGTRELCSLSTNKCLLGVVKYFYAEVRKNDIGAYITLTGMPLQSLQKCCWCAPNASPSLNPKHLNPEHCRELYGDFSSDPSPAREVIITYRGLLQVIGVKKGGTRSLDYGSCKY